MAVVTISRQYGAGGLRVAPLVAAALGFRLADRELVEEAARRLGVDPEVAQGWDERAPAVPLVHGHSCANHFGDTEATGHRADVQVGAGGQQDDSVASVLMAAQLLQEVWAQPPARP